MLIFESLIFSELSLMVIGNHKMQENSCLAGHRPMMIVFFSKNYARFSTLTGKNEIKNGYGSLRLLNISKNVVQIMIGIHGLYKKNVRRDRGLPRNLTSILQVENGLHFKSLYRSYYNTNFNKILCKKFR